MNKLNQSGVIMQLKVALSKHVAENKELLGKIYDVRFWLIVVLFATLILPVFTKNTGQNIGWSGDSTLNGWEVIFPAITFLNNKFEFIGRKWAIDPVALGIYLGLGYMAYNAFVGVKSKYESIVSTLVLILVILLPLVHFPITSWLLPSATANYYPMAVTFGWVILLVGTIALSLAYYSLKINASVIDKPDSLSSKSNEIFPESDDQLPPPLPSSVWHYAIENDKFGPLTVVEIKKLVQDGVIKNSTLMWKKGMANWSSFESIDKDF
jgi:hypothetical protein